MKFKLDQKVIYNGEEVIVWDYSHRYKDYTIKLKSGKIIYNVKENEIKGIA